MNGMMYLINPLNIYFLVKIYSLILKNINKMPCKIRR